MIGFKVWNENSKICFEINPGKANCDRVREALAEACKRQNYKVEDADLTFTNEQRPEDAAANSILAQQIELLESLWPNLKGTLKITWGCRGCIKLRTTLLGRFVPSDGGTWIWAGRQLMAALKISQEQYDELVLLSGC